MKKIFITLVVLILSQLGYAQDSEDIFREFGKEKNAECVIVSPFLMTIGKMFAKDKDDSKMLSKINSLKVLDLEECSQSVRSRFASKMDKLKLNGYETMVQVNDEGEKVHILMKIKKDEIRELLIVCVGDGDCALVQFKGKISKNDLAELVNSETTKKNGRH